MGIGVTLLAQTHFINKLFPPEPVPEKIVPTTDPKIVEELISLHRQFNQLESKLKDSERELKAVKKSTPQPAPPSPKGNVDVIELSQVIEANNLANANLFKRGLEEQRKALLQEHLLIVESEIRKVENKYRPTLNKINELETHLETQTQILQKEKPARLLWISCQSLIDRMRFASQEPLERDPAYELLKQFAAEKNALAISVLDSIPAKALKEGVQSEESLINRFSKVEKICKRVALVDERGGGVAKYLISYLQSLFIIDTVKVSEDEVSGKQLVDPTSWQTFDILARVKYCLLRRNLEQAVRYANQLRGQARVVARDWIRDARVHLETMQAFSVLSTHAEAIAVDAVRQTFVK